MLAHLTITLDSEEQPVQPFLDAIFSSIDILREVDAHVSQPSRGATRWLIQSLHYGSPASMAIRAAPETGGRDVGTVVVEQYIKGIEALMGGREPPESFSEKAIQSAQRLGKIAGDGRALTLSMEGHRVEVAPRVAANAADILRRSFSTSGSVEGILEMATLHDNTYCRVYDAIHGRGIACYFDKDFVDQVREGFGKRVSITGKLRSNRWGQPESMRVESLKVFRSERELPSIEMVRGIAKGLTDGIPSEDYVREIRGDVSSSH